jgi:2-methylisocitrate lyase-like PEP mutase family enzyme
VRATAELSSRRASLTLSSTASTGRRPDACGARRISLGSALSRAALGAFLRAAREISERGTFTFGDEAASFAELNQFMAAR